LPKGRAYLADQLRRASLSILNIAEGAGEYAPADKGRCYRMARRSATESAAILDACKNLALADLGRLTAGRELLLRAVAMLTGMVLRMLPDSGSDSDSGSKEP
jgi:four helix bundle protein